jgi:hypothetical protein
MGSTLSRVLRATLPICIDYSLISSMESGVYSIVNLLAEPYGALRNPESGNYNQLSFTRSEHLESIARDRRGAGLPE